MRIWCKYWSQWTGARGFSRVFQSHSQSIRRPAVRLHSDHIPPCETMVPLNRRERKTQEPNRCSKWNWLSWIISCTVIYFLKFASFDYHCEIDAYSVHKGWTPVFNFTSTRQRWRKTCTSKTLRILHALRAGFILSGRIKKKHVFHKSFPWVEEMGNMTYLVNYLELVKMVVQANGIWKRKSCQFHRNAVVFRSARRFNRIISILAHCREFFKVVKFFCSLSTLRFLLMAHLSETPVPECVDQQSAAIGLNRNFWFESQEP